jgi:hypothetical protein
MRIKRMKKRQAYKTRWHKHYNRKHRYGSKGTEKRRYTREEMYLIWHKRLQGGRILTDVQIAKLLKRSLQGIQLKRHKMVKGGVF